MTVLGISGCTALMLTGFGLKESISTIVLKQFDDIFTYDALVVVDDTSSREELLAVEESLGESPQILGWMPVRQQTMDAGGEGRWQQVYLFCPPVGGGDGGIRQPAHPRGGDAGPSDR